MTKKCKVCKLDKPLDLFGKHPRCILGVRPECKSCYNDKKRAYNKKWDYENKEYHKKYEENKRLAKDAVFMEKRRILGTEDYKKNTQKYKARQIARYYLDIDCLCEVCKKKSAQERHHSDYSKPLDVLMVCVPCHKNIHFGGDQ